VARRLVVLFSDTHAGSRLGLLSPDTVLWEEDQNGQPAPWQPQPTAVQQWLWGHYASDIAAVIDLAAGDPVILVHNGDLTWGRKYASELVSTRDADQILIAIANLAPWFEHANVQTVRLVHGTDSHAFGEATSDALVCDALRVRWPERSVAEVRHALLLVDGVGIDCAHHGPGPGGRQWLTGNQARYYAKSLMNDDLLVGRTPPRVIVRSHFHTYVRETVRVHGAREVVTDVIVTPAYCGMTEYATQATRSGYLISCGLVVLEIVDGALREIHPFVRAVDLRREEVL
jgi:hypothetical protein